MLDYTKITFNELDDTDKPLQAFYNYDLKESEIDSFLEEYATVEEVPEGYIHEVCVQIEAGRVKNYCENETVNLIFSSFAGRAESAGATMNIKAVVPYILPVSETDLCVLLSNALENALHACTAQEQKGTIDILAYEKNGRFFFQVTNPCRKEVVFENGVPVTDRPGHGIGVRSICAIVDRYGGMYSFLVEDNKFILRVSL